MYRDLLWLTKYSLSFFLNYYLQGVSSVQFSSVHFSSVQFSSVQFSSVQFSSVHPCRLFRHLPLWALQTHIKRTKVYCLLMFVPYYSSCCPFLASDCLLNVGIES